jgi:hypothetical protein
MVSRVYRNSTPSSTSSDVIDSPKDIDVSLAKDGNNANETTAVFDDIENMFHGLTNELNELLTQPQ